MKAPTPIFDCATQPVTSGLTRQSAGAQRPAVQELQQVLREVLRVQDVGEVLLSRQHQQPRVRKCGCDRANFALCGVRAFLADQRQNGHADLRCLLCIEPGPGLA